MKSVLSVVIAFFLLCIFMPAKSAYALNVIDKANEEIKTAKTSLEEAKVSLNKAESIIDSILGVFKFVEEKITMLYNFESLVNNLYDGVLIWSQNTLKWVEEEKGEEVKKLNYEYNNCCSYI